MVGNFTHFSGYSAELLFCLFVETADLTYEWSYSNRIIQMNRYLFGLVALPSLFALTLNHGFAKEMTGKQIYKYCKACHGDRAQGGESGKYPRLAGLPKEYLARQLKDFKEETRANKPMIPVIKHVNFDAGVIDKVSAYMAGLTEPKLSLWPYEVDKAILSNFDSGQAFADVGKEAYSKNCAACHGDAAQGGAAHQSPPLVNQYPQYLAKQMQDFAEDLRSHEHSKACGSLDASLRESVLNHLVELSK